MSLLRKKKTESLPTEPVDYPAGICVETPKGRFLIHRDGRRYRIPSEEIYKSWYFPLTVKTSEAAVAAYRISMTPLVFRDGTLIFNIRDARLYLVSGGKRRQITSPAALRRLGATRDSAMVVSDADVNLMKLGAAIN